MKKRICFRITQDGGAYGMSLEFELKDGSTYDPSTANIDKKGLMEAFGIPCSPDEVELISPEQFDAEFPPEDLEEIDMVASDA